MAHCFSIAPLKVTFQDPPDEFILPLDIVVEYPEDTALFFGYFYNDANFYHTCLTFWESDKKNFSLPDLILPSIILKVSFHKLSGEQLSGTFVNFIIRRFGVKNLLSVDEAFQVRVSRGDYDDYHKKIADQKEAAKKVLAAERELDLERAEAEKKIAEKVKAVVEAKALLAPN